MKVVIDIREDTYNTVCEMGNGGAKVIDDAIKNGIVLPKNHGRLIDADALVKKYERDKGRQIYVDNFIFDLENNAPTIIEADKAESENKE